MKKRTIFISMRPGFLAGLLAVLLILGRPARAGLLDSTQTAADRQSSAAQSPAAASVWLDGDTLYYQADSGQQNQVTTSAPGSELWINDSGAPLTPGAGCAAVDANTVSCPAAGVARLDLSLGDQNDSAVLTTHLNASVDGGGGLFNTDTLTITGTASNDTFVISGTQVTRSGGESATFSGIEALGVDGLGSGLLDMDSYTVNFGGLPLMVTIGDSGSAQVSLDSLAINGTSGADSIVAAAGTIGLVTFPPQLISQHGVELIQVYGGAGDDVLNCGLSTWPLLIYGQQGDDELTGSLLGGSLDGGDGNDILHASTGPELLSGGAGDDTYLFSDHWTVDAINESSGGGWDTLDFSGVTTNTQVTISPLAVADAGIDRLTAGNSLEALKFGSEDDTFTFGNGALLAGGAGTIDGGGGINRLDYAAYTSGVSVDLAAGAASGTAGVTQIRDVTGGSAADTINGDNANNTLTGNAGDDQLAGGAGNDTLDGGAGNDRLAGGAGNDALNGGSGNDGYVFEDGWGRDTFSEAQAEGADTLDFSTATASLSFQAAQTITVTAGANTTTGANVETLSGGAAADSFDVNASGLILDGQGGPDAYTVNFNWAGVLTIADSGADGRDTLLAETWPGGASVAVYPEHIFHMGAQDLAYAGLEALTIQGSAAQDQFQVDGWSADELLLLGGDGDDLFYIDQAGAGLTADGQDGSDQYFLSFEGINNAVTLADSGTGGVDRLSGDGTPGDDTFTISDTQTTCGSATAIYGATIEAVEMHAGEGDDTFNVRASPAFTITVDGGGQPAADVLNFDAQSQPVTWDWPNQVITVPGRRPVYYYDIERVNFLNRWLYQVWLAFLSRVP